jgi:hypothetical protein
MRVVIDALKEEDFAQAEAVVAGELTKPHSDAVLAQLRDIQQAILEASAIPKAIEREFQLRLGTEITINQHERPLPMVLRSVINGRVTAEIRTGRDPRTGRPVRKTISFTLDQLNPMERSKWVPGRSAAANTMRCVLLMKAGDMDEACSVAPGCGPLSEVFEALLAR